MKSSLLDRFWTKVQKTDSCWLWSGGVGTSGYGQFKLKYGVTSPHRWLWIHLNPDCIITPAMIVKRSCNNKLCVNPDHLFLASKRKEVLRDGSVAKEVSI